MFLFVQLKSNSESRWEKDEQQKDNGRKVNRAGGKPEERTFA